MKLFHLIFEINYTMNIQDLNYINQLIQDLEFYILEEDSINLIATKKNLTTFLTNLSYNLPMKKLDLIAFYIEWCDEELKKQINLLK